MANPSFVLIASCPDRTGIVARVAGFFADRDCFIVDSHDHSDPDTGQFFLRTVFRAPPGLDSTGALSSAFHEVRDALGMRARFYDMAHTPRVLILASKEGHCLNDLLYQRRAGILPVEIPAVVSNHEVLREEVEWHGIPFHHLPVSAATKADQEARILDIIDETRSELVVLARYMQILSPELCERLAGRCINIHHSFLPGFKGARPYKQAYDRGVKLIGATAHYVTSDLDEGPIIEQAVERVNHGDDPSILRSVGRDIERRVLARAVKWHVEHRVLINGRRTVVFG